MSGAKPGARVESWPVGALRDGTPAPGTASRRADVWKLLGELLIILAALNGWVMAGYGAGEIARLWHPDAMLPAVLLYVGLTELIFVALIIRLRMRRSG